MSSGSWNKRRIKLTNPKSAAASGRRKGLQAVDRLREGVTKLNMSSEHLRNRAEALFKKVETRLDGNKAMAEYHAVGMVMRQRRAG
jgi:hypothetical protein